MRRFSEVTFPPRLKFVDDRQLGNTLRDAGLVATIRKALWNIHDHIVALAPAASRAGYFIVGSILLMAASVNAQPLREITFGLPSTSIATGSGRVAQEMGLFAKRGLNAKFVVIERASVATSALISGSVMFTMSGPGELIAAQANGQKVITIATVYGGLAATLVISKPVADKLGASLATGPVNARLKALDGMVIAGASATSAATVAFDAAARAVGAKLRFTYMNQPSMPAALDSGAIQGYVASAPFWSVPVVKGTGVVWVSGSQGEVPAEFSPVTASIVQTMRATADVEPELMTRVAAVFADFAKAVDERPAEVKAVTTKLFPEADAATIDLFFKIEAASWKAKPLTAKEMAREIEFMKLTGASMPGLDKLDPATMVFP